MKYTFLILKHFQKSSYFTSNALKASNFLFGIYLQCVVLPTTGFVLFVLTIAHRGMIQLGKMLF